MAVKDAEALPEGHVKVRVMRKGDDRIYRGTEVINTKGDHFPRYAKGEELTMPLETADKYEEDGWVEILA